MTVLEAAASGIRANVGVSLCVRACTFILNILVARFTDPASYGRANVSFYLLQALGLFATKEVFRRAAVRKTTEDTANKGAKDDNKCDAHGSAVRLAMWSIVAAVGVNAVLLSAWIYYPPSLLSGRQRMFYPYAAVTLFFANVLEAAAEPYVVIETLDMHLTTRARAEAAAFLLRSTVFFVMVVAGVDFLFAYAVGQCCFSIVWYMWFRSAARHVPAAATVAPHHVHIVGQFALTGVQKLVLTEAEKVFLMAWFDQDAWGTFSLVSNLGSLILRLLFAPLEDVAFSSFSRANREDSVSLLQTLVGIQGTLGLCAALLGPLYANVVIYILYGSVWMHAVPTLQIYSIFLFFAAINGVLEAYCFATANKRWLTTNQVAQFGISLTMCVLCYALRRVGPVSLVAANAVCMLLRVLRCSTWIRESLSVHALIHEVIPKITMVALWVAVASAGIIFIILPAVAPAESRVSANTAIIAAQAVLGAVDILVMAFLLRREGTLLFGALVKTKKN